jgi:hypothetical protein
VHRVALLTACVSLLAGACSGSLEGVGGNRDASTPSGSGGSTGIAGTAGRTSMASTGSSGGSSETTGTTGAGGQGGMDEPDARIDPGEAGGGASNDGAIKQDAAFEDAGPRPLMDYAIWQLQLPTGSGTSPDTVPPSQLATFSNIYFYRAADGGQIFMDPATGITTQNSTRCRTELRETDPSGAAAAWSPTGTNVMTVTGKVLQGSSITVGQVFNGTDGITLAELQYSPNGFTVFYEESRSGGGSTGLGNRTALNTNYTFTMEFSQNVLTITINGNRVYTHTPSAGILNNKFYFKAGNYDQTTSAGTPSTTPHSIVEDYSIAVVHR